MPLPYGAHRNGAAQRKDRAGPATSRLGSLSISDTKSLLPSELALRSYQNCPVDIKITHHKMLLDFITYMQTCDKSGFHADGIAPLGKGSGLREVSGPLMNRWHPKRRVAWIARMHRISEWYEANRIQGCTLISMTGYQERSGYSFYDTWDNIQEARIKLLKILRKYYKGEKIDYFWVVEPHTENNTGYPHIHLAIFREIDNNIKDKRGRGMEDKLRDLYSAEWGTGSHTYGLDFDVMKGENTIKNLKNYLMKYISKGYVSDKLWSPGELLFNAYLFGATHGYRPPKDGEVPDNEGRYTKKYRLVGMSRTLSEILKPDEEDKETIVWLHTDEIQTDIINNIDGTTDETITKKVLYHRQLIPDWLDSLIGYQRMDWGRPTKPGIISTADYDPVEERRKRVLRDTDWADD